MSATTSRFERNMFRVRGDTVEIFPAYSNDKAIRVEFFGDEIDRISEINVVTGMPTTLLNHAAIYPASHYVTTKEKMAAAIDEHQARECDERVKISRTTVSCSRRSAYSSARITI